MILTACPSVTKKEIDYVTDAITNGHGEHWGDYIKKFEKSFAEYIGVKHSMSTSSCTGALHLSLVGLGIGHGDEVIVPDTSWIATASAVTYVGATPVFADVDKDSWCLSAHDIINKLTHKTKAIIPVHLYGNPADMTSIMQIANEYDLKVVEDAAPSVGSLYNGKRTGGFGDVGCFSFQGAKMLSTGEGGMLVTNNSDVFDRIKHFSEHGRSGSGFDISDIGFKYKMSNLQAAFGLAQLERVDELVAKKRQIYEWYSEYLDDVDGLQLNKKPDEHSQSNYWMTSIVLDKDFGVSREWIMAELKQRGIDTRPFFQPMSSFRMFKDQNNRVAKRIGSDGINLPSAHYLTREDIFYVCDRLKSILRS